MDPNNTPVPEPTETPVQPSVEAPTNPVVPPAEEKVGFWAKLFGKKAKVQAPVVPEVTAAPTDSEVASAPEISPVADATSAEGPVVVDTTAPVEQGVSAEEPATPTFGGHVDDVQETPGVTTEDPQAPTQQDDNQTPPTA